MFSICAYDKRVPPSLVNHRKNQSNPSCRCSPRTCFQMIILVFPLFLTNSNRPQPPTGKARARVIGDNKRFHQIKSKRPTLPWLSSWSFLQKSSSRKEPFEHIIYSKYPLNSDSDYMCRSARAGKLILIFPQLTLTAQHKQTVVKREGWKNPVSPVGSICVSECIRSTTARTLLSCVGAGSNTSKPVVENRATFPRWNKNSTTFPQNKRYVLIMALSGTGGLHMCLFAIV